jgi:Ion channel
MSKWTAQRVPSPTPSPNHSIGHPGRRRYRRLGRARVALAQGAHVHGAHRYAVLFYALLLTLAAAPLLTALGFDADLLQIFLTFSLLVALLGVPGHRRRMLLLIVAAVVVGLRVAPASAVGDRLSTGALVAGSALALVAAASAVRFAVRAPAIDSEHIYAALSAYLLGGLFFGVLHWAIAATWPGSFSEAGAATSAPFPLSTAIYYSFVTLATLGYGDVVPRTEVARGLAVLEAVGGQLYIAVTIARLVGAQLQTPRPDSERNRDAQPGGGRP